MKKLICIFVAIFICYTANCQKTYYGYVERDSSHYVNWSKVGSDFNKSLNDAYEIRRKRLEDAGWSSEAEYIAYKRNLRAERKQRRQENKANKKMLRSQERIRKQESISKDKIPESQERLRRQYERGNPKVSIRYDSYLNSYYYKEP
jgi:hypothetical protein